MTKETIYLSNGCLKPKGALARALKQGASPNEGWVSLHEAVVSGRMDALDLLIEYGADLEAQDGDGDTALMRACTTNALSVAGSVRMLERLIHYGAEINRTNHLSGTPLLACVKAGRAEAMLVLLMYGADLNVVDRVGRGVFALADEYSTVCADALRIWLVRQSKGQLIDSLLPMWTSKQLKGLFERPVMIERKYPRKL